MTRPQDSPVSLTDRGACKYRAVLNQAPAALSTWTCRFAPSGESQPWLRAFAIIASHRVAQSGDVARGSAAARSAAVFRYTVSASWKRPRPARHTTPGALPCPPHHLDDHGDLLVSTRPRRGFSTQSPSDMPGEAGEVRIALLQEGVPPIDRLLPHEGQRGVLRYERH